MRSALTALLALSTAARVGAAPPPPLLRLAVVQDADLQAWDARIGQLVRAGTLRAHAREADPLVPGRVHERFAQLHAGVPVWGGEMVRQSDAGGPVSVFGTYYEWIGALSVTPALSAEQAAARVSALAGHPALGTARLYVFPRRDAEGYALAWRIQAYDGQSRYAYFLDAASGALVHRLHDLPTQVPISAVGPARGVLDDAKKMSAEPVAGGYTATDRLRPSLIRTYDLKGNLSRAIDYFFLGRGRITNDDLALDADNDWRDGAVVDAHTYTGWTYDYYFKRLGRRGLDNRDGTIFAMVHPVRREDARLQSRDVIGTFYANAFYFGSGILLFGEGLPPELRLAGTNQQVNYVSGALDIVAHELTHGVTEYSSNLEYEDESGALNEAFSDIMGTSVEFFFQEPGSGPMRADYLVGEDVFTPGGIRSMANPTSQGDPDHYAVRFQAGGPCAPENDFCGVHINSGIPNHAFYLAVEGGQNRVSGLSVQGVGAANREQIERAFYRAFTQMLPSTASFATARAATVQSARDLFGAGSAPERAITQAWAAVGVP